MSFYVFLCLGWEMVFFSKHLRAAPQTRRAWKNDMFWPAESDMSLQPLYKAGAKLGQPGKSRSVPLPNNLKFSNKMFGKLPPNPTVLAWTCRANCRVEQLPPSRFTLEKCLRWDFIQVCCLNQLQHEYKLIIWQTVYALRRYMMLFLSLSLVVGMYSSLALPITVS